MDKFTDYLTDAGYSNIEIVSDTQNLHKRYMIVKVQKDGKHFDLMAVQDGISGMLKVYNSYLTLKELQLAQKRREFETDPNTQNMTSKERNEAVSNLLT